MKRRRGERLHASLGGSCRCGGNGGAGSLIEDDDERAFMARSFTWLGARSARDCAHAWWEPPPPSAMRRRLIRT